MIVYDFYCLCTAFLLFCLCLHAPDVLVNRTLMVLLWRAGFGGLGMPVCICVCACADTHSYRVRQVDVCSQGPRGGAGWVCGDACTWKRPPPPGARVGQGALRLSRHPHMTSVLYDSSQ